MGDCSILAPHTQALAAKARIASQPACENAVIARSIDQRDTIERLWLYCKLVRVSYSERPTHGWDFRGMYSGTFPAIIERTEGFLA